MQNKSEASTAPSENSNPREKSNQGFYKRRRGVYEHIEDGTIDLLENGIHDYLCLKANLVIGRDSSKPAGVCFTSAPDLRAHCKRWVHSDRTMQRIIDHMERIGWIRTWPRHHGNYPVLICRATVHDLSGNEYRVNADATTDWQHPVYEPVGQLSANASKVGDYKRYKRIEKLEKREEAEETAAAPTSPKPERQNPNPKGKSNTQDLEGKSSRVSKEKRSLEAWVAIGEEGPFGPRWFVSGWEKAYAQRPAGEKLSDTMENYAQGAGRKLPPKFYNPAKRWVEEREAREAEEAEERRPFGASPFPPELMR